MTEKLKSILAGTVPQVTDAVSTMDAGDLAELRTLEQADASPRRGVLDAIEAREKALEEAAKPPTKAEPKAAAKPADKADAKPWQAPDYSGPLSGEQAAWRNANLKPVRDAKTK